MKLKKIRNALLVVLTLALVSATTVAITWAASTAKFTNKENTFTNNPLISLQFQELTFDGLPYGTDRTANDANVSGESADVTSVTLPDGTTISKGKDLGYHLARKYTPGQFIPKNPQLKNNSGATMSSKSTSLPTEDTAEYVKNSTTSDEWVALTVKYSMSVKATDFALDSTNASTNDGSDSSKAYVISHPAEDITINFVKYDDFAKTIATVRTTKEDNSPLTATGTNAGFRMAASAAPDDHKWSDISPAGAEKTRFMFDDILADGAETKTLFDCVKINEVGTGTNDIKQVWVKEKGSLDPARKCYMLVDPNTNNKYFFDTLPDFKIEMEGYAIQADNVAFTAAPAALNAFINSKSGS